MIEDYASLQTAIGKWLDRDDDDLVDRIPEFIQLAEAKIKRRVRRKSIRTTLNVSAEATTMPADCVALRSIYPRTGSPSRDRAIKVCTPEQLIEHRAALAPSGRPKWAVVVAGQLLLAPAPDQTYSLEVIYFEKLSPLSDSNVTNSVLIEAPDIYLYGALAEAEPYLKNDERVALWKTLFNDGVQELDTARQEEEYNASLRPIGLPVVLG